MGAGRKFPGPEARGPAGAADGCEDGEILNGSVLWRTGTGAIRQEFLINSRLSAPQAQDVKSFACPVRQGAEPLRVSPIFADVRRTGRAARLRTGELSVCWRQWSRQHFADRIDSKVPEGFNALQISIDKNKQKGRQKKFKKL